VKRRGNISGCRLNVTCLLTISFATCVGARASDPIRVGMEDAAGELSTRTYQRGARSGCRETIWRRAGREPAPTRHGRVLSARKTGAEYHCRNGKQGAFARAADELGISPLLAIFIPLLTLLLPNTMRTLKSPLNR
jgi:hypothetical protein